MFRPEQQIGHYILIRRIGRGGFGEVWLAERRAKFVTTKVAVKLPLDEQIDHEAIRQEAVLWEQASGHPNVLPIIEADDYDGQVVIVSEYAPDGSLEDLLKKNEGSLPLKQAVEMTIGILAGLDFLHSRNIIHRDLKPANILLQGDMPRLADFGISRAMKTTSVSVNIAGTPIYMSPEAFDRKRNVQTDIWAIGVILYQMLTGEFPFPIGDISEIIAAIVMHEAEPLPDEFPPKLQRIVKKALAKQPTERYQTARYMRGDLADFLVSISQQEIRETLTFNKKTKKTEIKTEVLPPDSIAQTQASPTMQSPVFVANTDGQKLAETIQATEILELPKFDSRRPKTKSRNFKLLAPFTILILLAVGGVYFLINRTTSTNENSKQNTVVNLDDVQLIPYRKGDKFGFCDANKKIVIEPKYADVFPFSEGFARVRLNDKEGFIDKVDKEIIQLKYTKVDSFKDNLAVACLNKCGVIDKTGKEVIPFDYKSIWGYSEGMFMFTTFESNSDFNYGFMDSKGNVVSPPEYFLSPSAEGFSDGLAPFFSNKKQLSGYVDKTGKEILINKYRMTSAFSQGLSVVEVLGSSKSQIINKSGDVIAKFDYPMWKSFSEGVAAVLIETMPSKFSYVDTSGKLVTDKKFDFAGQFHEGLATVNLNNKRGFIDRRGNFVIPPKYNGNFDYDNASFTEGLARVQLNNIDFYIDKNGTEYYEP